MDRRLETPPFVSDWVQLTDYRDISALLRSPATGVGRDDVEFIGQTVPGIDGAEHVARRQLESRMFSASALALYERDTLSSMLDGFFTDCATKADADGVVHVDLVPFGLDMLIRIGASIAGIDGADSPATARRLLDQIDLIAAASSAEWAKGDVTEVREHGRAGRAQFVEEFLEPSMARRAELLRLHAEGSLTREDLPTDLVTLLLAHRDESWGPEVFFREVPIYLMASIRTSTRALCNVVCELSEWFETHPEDRARVGDLTFIRAAVEETLRLHPVLPILVRRMADELTLPSGRVLAAGDKVAVLFAVANRDTTIFGDNAAEFDLHRTVHTSGIRPYGLAFGGGPHTCIGRRLAVGGAATDDEEPTVGSVTTLLMRLYQAGVELDPARRPVPHDASFYDEFLSLPVRLPNALGGAVDAHAVTA